MGNRCGIIINDSSGVSTTTKIYLHWNGGYESIVAFAEYAKEIGLFKERSFDHSYLTARMVQIIGNFFGGFTSIGIYGVNDGLDDSDNGTWIINVLNNGDYNILGGRGAKVVDATHLAKMLISIRKYNELVFADRYLKK